MRTNQIKHRFLLKEFIEIQSHLGPLHKNSHFSLYPFSLGFRNQFCVYDLEKSLIAFKRGIRLLKKPLLIVGCPEGLEDYFTSFFENYSNIRFFPYWVPGILTKNLSEREVVVIYNIDQNRYARIEALQTQNPIVAFVAPSCNIYGVDYPIPLSFNNPKGNVFYIKLWTAILNKRENFKF